MPVVQPAQQQNCTWPVTRVARGWKRGVLDTRFESALRFLLLTPLGSLVWAPHFGTRIHLYRTQHIDEQDAHTIKAELEIAVGRWIPDIRVTGIEVDQNPEDFRVAITVHWMLPSAQPGGGEPILRDRKVTVEY